jgi:multicomponent Na+:H+ antiporter subunit E
MTPLAANAPGEVKVATTAGARATPSLFVSRVIVFLIVWLILMGPGITDLPAGLVAACAAAWSSLMLWPSGGGFSVVGILRFILRFVPQSVMAGLSVARIALFPARPLVPGFASYRTQVPAGMARRAFCAVMSLQPGKLPVGVGDDGVLLIHCLDGTGTVAEEVAADEQACMAIMPREARHA